MVVIKLLRFSDWLRAWTVRVSNPGEGVISVPVRTGPGVHPASCAMGTGSCPGVKSGRGVTLTSHPLLVPSSRKNRAIPLLPLWAVRPVQSLSACTMVHFSLFTFSVLFKASSKSWWLCPIMSVQRAIHARWRAKLLLQIVFGASVNWNECHYWSSGHRLSYSRIYWRSELKRYLLCIVQSFYSYRWWFIYFLLYVFECKTILHTSKTSIIVE